METVQQLLSVITIIVSTHSQTIELYCRKWEKSGRNTQDYSVMFRVQSGGAQRHRVYNQLSVISGHFIQISRSEVGQ